MARPFNRNHWNPIRHAYYTQPQIHPRSKPNIINIPVQFVATGDRTSEMMPAAPLAKALVAESEEARVFSATTIQKAVRGFLVRKNARIVRQVAGEVDEIERKFKGEEAVISLDTRERLRVNEALMALLLRLDSVRGVREFRKKVIRRVITLQEKIDSIPVANDGAISTIGIAEDMMDSNHEASAESSIDNAKTADQTLDLKEEAIGADIELEMEIPASVESQNRMNDPITAGDGLISMSGIAEDQYNSSYKEAEETTLDHEGQDLDQEEETNEATTEMEMKNQGVDESPKRESTPIAFGVNELSSPELGSIRRDDGLVASQQSPITVESPAGIGMRELMENMAAENERLKEMVAQLCATSAEQCRLMEGLAGRVEQLERVVYRMDRRRKKRGVASSAISSAK